MKNNYLLNEVILLLVLIEENENKNENYIKFVLSGNEKFNNI